MKYCPSCKIDKDESEFYPEPKRSGGLSSNCRACKKARGRRNAANWYRANSQHHINAVLAARAKHNPPAPD